MVDVLEVVPLHVDHHPPLNILKVIRQAGNEVPDKHDIEHSLYSSRAEAPGDEVVYLPLIAFADLFSGRCSHWSDGGVVAYISPCKLVDGHWSPSGKKDQATV